MNSPEIGAGILAAGGKYSLIIPAEPSNIAGRTREIDEPHDFGVTMSGAGADVSSPSSQLSIHLFIAASEMK